MDYRPLKSLSSGCTTAVGGRMEGGLPVEQKIWEGNRYGAIECTYGQSLYRMHFQHIITWCTTTSRCFPFATFENWVRNPNVCPPSPNFYSTTFPLELDNVPIGMGWSSPYCSQPHPHCWQQICANMWVA